MTELFAWVSMDGMWNDMILVLCLFIMVGIIFMVFNKE